MARWEVDVSGITALTEKMSEYGAGSGQIIKEYFKDEGYERIAAHIPGLIHASGRTWKGKTTSATKAGYKSVFQGDVEDLTLIVKTKCKYHYLYFPDDGSNTTRHYGNQGFMLQGAEDQSGTMVDEMVGRLTAAFNE